MNFYRGTIINLEPKSELADYFPMLSIGSHNAPHKLLI